MSRDPKSPPNLFGMACNGLKKYFKTHGVDLGNRNEPEMASAVFNQNVSASDCSKYCRGDSNHDFDSQYSYELVIGRYMSNLVSYVAKNEQIKKAVLGIKEEDVEKDPNDTSTASDYIKRYCSRGHYSIESHNSDLAFIKLVRIAILATSFSSGGIAYSLAKLDQAPLDADCSYCTGMYAAYDSEYGHRSALTDSDLKLMVKSMQDNGDFTGVKDVANAMSFPAKLLSPYLLQSVGIYECILRCCMLGPVAIRAMSSVALIPDPELVDVKTALSSKRSIFGFTLTPQHLDGNNVITDYGSKSSFSWDCLLGRIGSAYAPERCLAVETSHKNVSRVQALIHPEFGQSGAIVGWKLEHRSHGSSTAICHYRDQNISLLKTAGETERLKNMDTIWLAPDEFTDGYVQANYTEGAVIEFRTHDMIYSADQPLPYDGLDVTPPTTKSTLREYGFPKRVITSIRLEDALRQDGYPSIYWFDELAHDPKSGESYITLGKKPKAVGRATFTVGADVPQSAVDAEHATIVVSASGENFTIRDHSTYQTVVKHMRGVATLLRKNEETELLDGDEIYLGGDVIDGEARLLRSDELVGSIVRFTVQRS